MSSLKKPMSKWWPIGLLISAVVLIIIGGALIGSAYSNEFCDGFGDCYYNGSEYDAGIALIILGVLVKLAFWIVLIVFIVRRRRLSSQTTNFTYANNNPIAGNVAPQQEQGKAHWNAPTAMGNFQPVPQDNTEYTNGQSNPLLENKHAAWSSQPIPVEGQYHDGSAAMGHGAPGGRYCLQCGTLANTPYCAQCGVAVPM